MKRNTPKTLVAFDTEGTTVSDDDGVFGVLYSWDWLELVTDPSDVSRETIGACTRRVTGRDCESLNAFLAERLQCAIDNQFCYKVGVHNLSYDYFYMRKFIKDCGYDVEITCKSSTNILNIKFNFDKITYLEFFDTLSLFGYSLRTLGANLGYPKLTIDYGESIAPDTMLNDENVSYNDTDTAILMLGMCKSLLTIPNVTLETLGETILTRTSIVRVGDRESSTIGMVPIAQRRTRGTGKRNRAIKSKPTTIYDNDRFIVGKHVIKDIDYLQKFMSYGDTITSDTKGCFAGGVNIANTDFVGVICDNVTSFDLKSAYPSIMLSYQIPVNSIEIKDDLESYKTLLDRFVPKVEDVLNGNIPFWVGKVRFENVRMRDDWREAVGDTSINKTMVLQCYKESTKVNFVAGHVESADVLVLNMSMPLFYEFVIQFDFDEACFNELTIFSGYEYPTAYSVLRVIEHYREKSATKKIKKDVDKGNIDVEFLDDCLSKNYITQDEHEMLVNGDPTDRWLDAFVLKHKGNLNSLYGIAVTNPVKDDYTFDENIEIEKIENEESEIDYTRNSMIWRESGVCVTLFNRYKIVYLANLLVECGAKILYTDTDSIKFIGVTKEVADDAFADTHDAIERQTNAIVSHVIGNINDKIVEMGGEEISIPSDSDFRALGKLDYEGTYERFVTMGHKKYAYYAYDRDENEKHWMYRCSGYNLRALQRVSDSLTDDGLGDMVPLVVLGFDNRYDSVTKVATVKSFVDNIWKKVEFVAKDVSGQAGTHVYRGVTCPGYAILDSGKIMNNTENSFSIRQLFEKACKNNKIVEDCSRIDITIYDGRVIIGKRGNVPMNFLKWDINYSENMEETGSIDA